jgi:hypothetical protein
MDSQRLQTTGPANRPSTLWHKAFKARLGQGETSARERTRPPVLQGLRVLTAGHSFHVFIADILPDLARRAGMAGHVAVGKQFLGGSRVIEHWNRPDSFNEAKRVLRGGRVDVLTLSPTFHPDEGIDRFTRLGREHNPDLRVTVQASWVPFDGLLAASIYPGKGGRDALTGTDLRELHAPYFQSLDEEVKALNEGYGKPVLSVVPVGQALIALREQVKAGQAAPLRSQEELFVDEIGHPSVPLQVLAAYCHFAVLYRRSPVGLSVPAVLGRAAWAEELNRLLQEVAWTAVREHPLSGVL